LPEVAQHAAQWFSRHLRRRPSEHP
jgi:hypothetical protein